MGRRVGEPEFGKHSWNDTGNAERLVERYQDRMRWVGDNEKWAVYDKETGLWSLRGVDHAAAGLMRTTIERMAEEEGPHYKPVPIKGQEKSERERWKDWCRTQGSAKTLGNGLTVARTKRALAAKLNQFDNDEGLLHCPNGVLDLRTFELSAHSPERMLTVGAASEYHPDAADTMWSEYLDTFLPDPELRRFVQKAVGYSLQVGNPARYLFFALGPSTSGKSTLNEVIKAMLGSYARAVNLSLFKANQKPGAPNSELAHALLARWVAATEASQQWRLHADEMKRITGGDTMQARQPHAVVDVQRRPSFAPWIFTNVMPNIEGRDQAFDRRLVVVPFSVSLLDKAKEDRTKTSRMLASSKTLSAALAWAVAGLRMYRTEGLEPPASVLAATEQAVSQLSDVDRFISERCELDVDHSEAPRALYDAYRAWCQYNDVMAGEMLNAIKFGQAMDQRGHKVFRTPKPEQARFRRGLRLIVLEQTYEPVLEPTYEPVRARVARRRRRPRAAVNS